MIQPRFWPLIASLALLGGCNGDVDAMRDTPSGSHGATAEDFERGPHRGRLLRDGDFALEVTIYETGVPPQFHLYAYRDDEPLPAGEVSATVELTRLGGKIDGFTFRPEGDHLAGDGTVVEPHSFDVAVVARHAGREHRWTYASYEGRTTIPAAVAQAAGVTIETVGPAEIRDSRHLMGRVVLNGDRHALVKARFPGLVQAVHVRPGDTVRAGQVMATVENRDSLRTYAVTAPLAGTVLTRHTNAGDVAGDAPLFEIADLSELWLELHAFGTEVARLRSGLAVTVESPSGGAAVQTTIERMLPLASEASQTVVARAPLPNPQGEWRPGMALSAEVTVSARKVPLAVKVVALQQFRDFTVVFAQFGDTYEVRMLELGDRDTGSAEVLGGIEAGTRYVVGQSYLIKADIEKSGASHDH